MRLIDAVIKKQGRPFKIPNCSRDQLPDFIKQLGLKEGAEIGVYRGRFTEKFCRKGLKMFAIDNWLVYSDGGRQTQARQEVLYVYAKGLLSRYKECTVIRKNSMDAVRDFKPESLDFVYIDADHAFKGIVGDIFEWYRRVRKGGVISGHDYACTDTNPGAQARFKAGCDVPAVVNAFVDALEIQTFYVFGRSKPLEQEAKDDKYLSWLFIKP